LFLHELNLKPFINKTLKINKIYFNIGVLNVQRCKNEIVNKIDNLTKNIDKKYYNKPEFFNFLNNELLKNILNLISDMIN